MTASIIIPARLESTRLPRKMLLSETGRPLILYSIDNALQSKLAQNVIVATDSYEIMQTVLKHRDDMILEHPSSKRHRSLYVVETPQMNSGTERVVWTTHTIRNIINSDLIINLQADEPELKSEHIDLLIETMSNSIDKAHGPAATIGTLATFSEQNSDPNMVKVVVDNQWNAMYFSRSPIPYGSSNLIHTGVYGYSYDTLMNLSSNPKPTQSLASENLEQLAWLQNGHKIKVILINHRPAGIDTREDYDMFVRRMRSLK